MVVPEPRPLACQDIVEALTRPVETTTAALLAQYELDGGDVLDGISSVQERLTAWEVECDPPLGRFDLDHPRILRRKNERDSEAVTRADLKNYENNECEFKETLYFDVKKNELGGRPEHECASEEVLLSSLKTIAGFCNTVGGTLYVGVSDERVVKGLNRDFPLVSVRTPDFDGWELFLRRKIEQFFHSGKGVSSSVNVERVVIDGHEIARVSVGARRNLAVMKWNSGDLLFIRNGNETLSVALSELEQHFELRKTYLP